MLKGLLVADTFYPFVENGNVPEDADAPTLVVRQPARIAIFDDAAAAPRVVVIEPSDIRNYLEEITKTVTQLAQEQGGKIPFTVIREVVENLIHAYFIEPTVSILDGGNTIRFSDQGPGIQDKHRALEYGTTSATTEMKRYIRGVGSGLPYAQQWLEDKGGSLTVEDNIHNGTVVTISLARAQSQGPAAPDVAYPQKPQVDGLVQQQFASYAQGYPAPQQPYATQQYAPQPYQQPQQQWPPQAPGYGYQAQSPYAPQQPYQPQAYQPYGGQPYGQPQPWQQTPAYQQVPQPHQNVGGASVTVSERGMFALEYLRTHESVGPRDLNACQPLSESTWSRVLAQLETLGLVSKQGGQKRRLTQQGRQFLGI
ncbi:MAG: MarR family transcriptional regulator [Atopobiaceae bacterium]|nr:MarR family transcriptional regulator [Atopobiaceae bacterium]